MFLSRESWRSRGPFMEADADGGGGNGASTEAANTVADDDEPDTSDLGDKGKAALHREREARKAAAERAKKAEADLDAALKTIAERDAAEDAAKEKAAEEAGKFQELAQKREAERDEAKADAAKLRAENDQFKAAMAEGLDVSIKALPDAVRKVLDATVDAEDVLGRWSWIHKAEVQALIAEHSEKQAAKSGNPANPKSSGSRQGNEEAARKAQSILYRNF